MIPGPGAAEPTPFPRLFLLPLPAPHPMRSFTIIAGLAVCLAACTSGERTGAAGSAGGTVVVEVNGDAHYLLPTLAEEETGAAVSELLFDPLAAMPRNLSTIGDSGWTPMLAKSCSGLVTITASSAKRM